MNFKQTVRNLVLILFFIFLNVMPSSAFSFRNMTLNVIQISDVHISDREDTSYKMLSSSKELLQDAIKTVNSIAGIDFVMFTGDMVDIATAESYNSFFTLLSELDYPSLNAFGNHDSAVCISGSDECTQGLKIDEVLEFVKKCNPNYMFNDTYYAFTPKTDFRIVVLDTVIRDEVTSNGYLTDEQLAFLDNELSQNQDKVVVIFQHHPPLEPFKSDDHSIKNADKYLEIVRKYKNPIFIFSGHYHATKITKEKNIVFVSTPSLVSYPNSFRQFKITNYRDRTEFKTEILETNLKDVQERAKLSTIAATTFYGTQKDRDISFLIRKSYVKAQKPPKKEKVKKEKKRKNKVDEEQAQELQSQQISDDLNQDENSAVDLPIENSKTEELPTDNAQDLLEEMMQDEQQI